MARCSMCFQEKPLVPPAVPGLPEQCKGCFYKIDQLLGYLAFHGVETMIAVALDDDPESPKNKKAKA
ncbi:hypothetical protein ES708_31787 [subsurface metagenome]